MTDRMTPEEAFELLQKTFTCEEHEHCAAERKAIAERFFNYPLIETASQKVVALIPPWLSGPLFDAIRELDEVIKNPFTGYKL